MSARRKARELVLKSLYAREMGEQDSEQDAGEIFSSISAGSKLDDETLNFARDLFAKIVAESETLDGNISRLSSNWSLERISLIDKNILRLSMTELSGYPDIPQKVSINEAVELAKRYGAAESPAFVNGILDAFAREMP